jgi:hypothetical protein
MLTTHIVLLTEKIIDMILIKLYCYVFIVPQIYNCYALKFKTGECFRLLAHR